MKALGFRSFLMVVILACLCLCSSICSGGTNYGSLDYSQYAPYMPEKYPPSLWFSTGDMIYVYTQIPMESAATIEASYEAFDAYMNPSRIFWRDAWAEWYDRYCISRSDSRHARFIDYWAKHDKQNRATELASRGAKQRGMEFWGITALFDISGGPESAMALQGGGPFIFIDQLRKAHPEYAAHDRQGIRSIPGAFEFAYPKVRREFVRRFDEMFDRKGAYRFYDGIQFYTYVENFCPRFENEYIYSDTVDKEYQKRYGVNPRTGSVDVEKYNAIRGEYLTQFLRDLRPVFKKHGKKLAIAVDAKDPQWPTRWGCAPPLYIRPTGQILMEWQKWIDEGLVDELIISMGTPDEMKKTVSVLLPAVKGTDVRLSIILDKIFPEWTPDELNKLLEEGVHFVNEQLFAEGGKYARGYRPPAELIDSKNDLDVLAVLDSAWHGDVDVPSAEKLSALLRHKNPLVRRQAAGVIKICGVKGCTSALEEAIAAEPETYVRAVLIFALGKTSGPNSVRTITDALAKHSGLPMELSGIDAFNQMGPERYADIVAAYDSPSADVRRVTVKLALDGQRPSGSTGENFSDLLMRAVRTDPDEDVRWRAATTLGSVPTEASCRALYAMLNDKSQANQTRAAFSLTSVLPRMTDENLRSQIRKKLLNIFNQYGKNSKRTDAKWGWKPVGYAIVNGCGTEGRDEMVKILNGPDKDLAVLAWEVLFVRGDDNNGYYPMSQEEVEESYTHYPGSPDFKPL